MSSKTTAEKWKDLKGSCLFLIHQVTDIIIDIVVAREIMEKEKSPESVEGLCQVYLVQSY